jgi:hypothetical protein
LTENLEIDHFFPILLHLVDKSSEKAGKAMKKQEKHENVFPFSAGAKAKSPNKEDFLSNKKEIYRDKVDFYRVIVPLYHVFVDLYRVKKDFYRDKKDFSLVFVDFSCMKNLFYGVIVELSCVKKDLSYVIVDFYRTKKDFYRAENLLLHGFRQVYKDAVPGCSCFLPGMPAIAH